MVTQTAPTLTSAEQRQATSRSRQEARANRTLTRRNARRVKYTAQPFDPTTLLADLRAERTAQ